MVGSSFDPFFRWVESTSFSMWITGSPSLFAFPGILAAHTIGLGLLAGRCEERRAALAAADQVGDPGEPLGGLERAREQAVPRLPRQVILPRRLVGHAVFLPVALWSSILTQDTRFP